MSTETDAAYALLGLKPGATKAQVDRGWRHLAREAHPDTHPHWTDAQRAKAEKRMKRLNAAHDLLEALLRDGAVPGPPPPSPPPPDVPRPRFEPSFIEFGSVGVADNGMTLQLDLCNRVGHIRNVAPLNTSGSFWRLDGGRAGVYPIRASFTVVVDIPASLTPGTYLEVLTMVVEGEELDVPICATVTAPAASRSSPPPRPAWAPAYAGAASAAPAAVVGSPDPPWGDLRWAVPALVIADLATVCLHTWIVSLFQQGPSAVPWGQFTIDVLNWPAPAVQPIVAAVAGALLVIWASVYSSLRRHSTLEATLSVTAAAASLLVGLPLILLVTLTLILFAVEAIVVIAILVLIILILAGIGR